MEKLLSRHRARVPVAELVGLLATGLISCSTDGSAAPSDELSTILYLYTEVHIDDLRPLVERQLTRVEPGKVNYFGFSFHEHQFTEQDRDVPRPVEAAFAAFDAFLGWMDALVGQGRVQYATAADIYRAYLDWEKK
jgi:hypothetical protein